LSMKVKVPTSNVSAFVSGYKSIKDFATPEGVIGAYLLQDAKEEESYTILNIIESEEALEKIRNGKVIKHLTNLLHKLDLEPTISVHNVVMSVD